MFFLFGLAGGEACAGSFLQGEGTWQAIAATRTSQSRLAYDREGYTIAAPRYRKVETSLYLEFGVTRDFTLILSPSVRDVRTDDAPARAAHGIGALEGGGRWRLFDVGREVVSFQALVRAPMRSDPGFAAENRPRAEMRIGVGSPRSVLAGDSFTDVSLAWIKRQEALPDEVRLDVTFGMRRGPDRMILFQYFNSLFPGPAPPGLAPRQHKFEASTVTSLGRGWSVQMGSFFSTGGLLTRRESGSTFAIWRRF